MYKHRTRFPQICSLSSTDWRTI